ncbi:hypothetical protein B0H14DRAFT_3533478 [Mycena olivaceomarginata]|nr:hypothetical protein B0H14DRAFT_3533478 [Mycena olivaceomarginata]
MEESEQSEEDNFTVELITRARVFNGNWQYYVKWDGYGSDEDTWEPAKKSKGGLRGKKRMLGDARDAIFDGSESDEAQSHHHTAAPKVAYRPSASTPAEQSEQATINSSTSSAEQQKWALLRSRNPALSFSPLPSAEELNLELEREPEQQYSLNSELIRRKVITVCAEFYEEVGALFKRTDPSVLSLCYPDDVDPLHLVATGKLRLQQVEEAAPSLAANTGITKPGERWHEIFLAPTLRSDPESADVGVHSNDAVRIAALSNSNFSFIQERDGPQFARYYLTVVYDHSTNASPPLPPTPHPPPDAVPVVVNGVLAAPNDPEHAVNGVLDDPATPVSNAVASEPKIDIDVPEQESDVRHEALPHPLEPAHASYGVNSTNSDVSMHDVDLHSPATMPVDGPPASSNGASTSHTSPADQDDDQPPPAKRPRILSDTDKALLTHCATPPPASVTSNGVSQAPTPSGRPTLDMGQWRFCISAIRSLKKQKDAPPFLHPVDPFALGIPHYHSIVRNPMDLSTIEQKLASSNPSKPDPNAETPVLP